MITLNDALGAYRSHPKFDAVSRWFHPCQTRNEHYLASDADEDLTAIVTLLCIATGQTLKMVPRDGVYGCGRRITLLAQSVGYQARPSFTEWNVEFEFVPAVPA